MTTRIVISTIPGEMRVAQLEDARTVDLQVGTSDRVLVTSIWAPWRACYPGCRRRLWTSAWRRRACFTSPIYGDRDEKAALSRIEDVIQPGDTLLVQVQKAPILSKGL